MQETVETPLLHVADANSLQIALLHAAPVPQFSHTRFIQLFITALHGGEERVGRRVLVHDPANRVSGPTTSALLRQRFGAKSTEFGRVWAEVLREIASIHAAWAEVYRAEAAGSIRVQ